MQSQQAPSRNWGEAVGKIANTGVNAWQLSTERKREAEQAAQQQQTGDKFLKAITGGGGGGGLAAALAANPNIMSHPQAGQYLSLAQAMAPKPPPKRQTAKDVHGRLRYLDDESPAFSDKILGPGPAPEAASAPSNEQLQMVRQLSSDWRETTKPMQVLLDQSDRMNIGLKMAQAGKMLAGSQAILISFNKLLDPTSVVRESEYARSATGQSAIETMRGYADKLSKGGAGVTLKELESYKEFGEQVVQQALESTIGPERKRIKRLIEYTGADPELIFTGRFAPNAQPDAPTSP